MSNPSSTFDKAWKKFKEDYEDHGFPIYNESDIVHYLRWFCQKLAKRNVVVQSHYSHGYDIDFKKTRSDKIKLAIEVKMSKHEEEVNQSYLNGRLEEFTKDIDRLKNREHRQRQGIFVLFDASKKGLWEEHLSTLQKHAAMKVRIEYFKTKRDQDGFYPPNKIKAGSL